MLARTLAALLLLLAACPMGSQTQVAPPPGGGPGSGVEPGPGPGVEPGPGPGVEPGSGVEPGPGPATKPPRGPKLGEPCGPKDACGEGSCVSYYGIAGPRGPEFKSCEIRCNPQGSCGGGRQCITIADGPGQVCRSPDAAQ
jgi:hypothetical protein